MNNNLLKINGEFVKFVVTADENVPEILKNSGIVTIVHDKNVTDDNAENKVNRNKIYIADEFIASGYGVRDEDAARKLQSISEQYDDAYTYFLNAYSYSTNYSTQLYDRIVNYYVSNIGETSSTYVMLDDYPVTLAEIRKLFVPARYDDFTINDTSYAQLTYNMNTFAIANAVTSYNHEYLSEKRYDLSDLRFNIPVGAHVTNFTTYFDINTVNHRGVNGAQAYVHTSKKEDPHFVRINEVYTTYNDDLPGIRRQFTTVSMNLTKNYSGIKHDYIVKSGDNTVIENYELYDAGSHEKKYYPLFEREEKYITSTENFIEPYHINFGDVNITGNHMIYYYQQRYNASISRFVTTLYSGMNNDDDSVRFTQIIDDETVMYYRANTTKQIILFAIPSCYDIEHVYYYDGYFRENCTGDVYVGSTKKNSVVSDFYLTVNDNNEVNSVNKIRYNLYKFEFRTDAYKKDLEIHLKLMKREDETTLVTTKSSLIDDTSYVSQYSTKFIQNELYNTMHWFKPVDLQYIKF